MHCYSGIPFVAQAAALGGVPAIVFLLLLPGTWLGLCLARVKNLWPTTAMVVVLIAAVAAFSIARLRQPDETEWVSVTAVATNRFPNLPVDWTPVWGAYLPTIRGKAPDDGIIVLPEKMVLLEEQDVPAAIADVQTLAREKRSTIVVGFEVRSGKIFRNRAAIVTRDTVHWYDKQRMLPGFEDRDVPGKAPLIVQTPTVDLGVAICKDMHIDAIGRQFAPHHAHRAAIMAIPAWDFGTDAQMGARMTQLRGVESGYGIVRASRNGYIGIYDRFGRILAERPAKDATISIVTAQLSPLNITTPFSRVGNLGGWVCLVWTILFRLLPSLHTTRETACPLRPPPPSIGASARSRVDQARRLRT